MSPPPAKRRRTSSPPPLLSPHAAGSPPPSQSPRPTPQPASPPVQRTNARKNPLDGFNDEEDSGEEPETRTRSTRTSSDMDHQPQSHEEEENEEEEHCAICLSPIENRAVVSPCHHGQFCWGCIRAWTDQSRKCPLCLGPIEHLIYNIRSAKDYQNHYLLPLHTVTATASSSEFVATFPPPPARGGSLARSRTGAATINNPTLPRHALYGRQSRTSRRFSSSTRVDERDEATWREREQERTLERRRYIYREGLYAKHVASNRYTGFKPFSPHTFSNNAELKAKVIKFIRRELQVFPAVDVAFLTTYLVSIASQLDLRSPSAIRLISDFLSEQDAQHLVHEISTFARSPFTSLEGYDRFVQYGRPQRRHAEEEEEQGGSMAGTGSDKPRFEEHMSRRRRERGEEEEEEGGERERRSSAGRLPFPSSTGRDSTRGAYRSGRSPSPPSAPLTRRYSSSSSSAPNGRRRPPPPPPASIPQHRQPYRPIEPNWRDRDQRYTGSYYATAASESRRGDGSGGGSGRRGRRGGFVVNGATALASRQGDGPAFFAAYEDEEVEGGSRRRYESRGRRRSSSPSLALPRRFFVSPPPPPSRRRRRRFAEEDDTDGPSRQQFSPSPAPGSYKDERETSPLPSSETRYQGHSRSPPSARSRSPARQRSRSRSRSKTPLQRPEPLSPLPSPPPPPPAAGPAGGGPAIDSELDDAISLVGPSFSIGPGSSKSNNSPLPSPLTATPAGPPLRAWASKERPISSSSTFDTAAPPPPPRGKPTLAIFGAARRLLGNGRVVTLARDGRASLQPQSDVFRNAGALGPRQTGGAAGANLGPRQQESYYGRATPNRLAASSTSSSSLTPTSSTTLGSSKKPLLGRLGGIVPPPISTAPAPSSALRDATASPTTPTSSKATSPADSLRAKLHARLTAEYRQALAASSRFTTLPPVSENPDGAVLPTTTTTAKTTTTTKSDLRSLLQARLQAEKALAYEDLVRTRAAASLASARDAQVRVDEPTVFSQETRDLLMARLDEERRFVDEEAQAGRPAFSTSSSAFDTFEYGNDLAYDDGYYNYASSDRTPVVFMDDRVAPELTPNEKDLVASSPSSSSAALAPASVTPSKSESSLKAALLAKRRATIQDELKKFSGQLKEKEMRQKLLMQKRRSGTTGGGGGGGASAEAQVQADP